MGMKSASPWTDDRNPKPERGTRETVPRSRFGFLFILVSSLVIVRSTFAAEAEQLAFFENDIRPLLIERCVKCHGPKKSESGLRLDTIATALKGGDSGPAVIPGQPADSLVMKAVRHEDDLEMPPDEKLSDREIAALERWIKGGAVWPEGMMLGGKGPQVRGGPITDEERAFWSFQPVTDPPSPQIEGEQIKNDIDRFILAKLREAKLNPTPPATKRVLIRRATFDLTGFPPTPEEIEAFLNDDSPEAFATIVDRLLKSKSYGERWGRHWLDVVRYADTAGETGDYPTPLSYKYRNWVINAFNADKPYDQFVRVQVAGDILGQKMADRLTASRGRQRENDSDDAAALGLPLNEDDRARYEEMLTATGFIAISRRFGFDVENYHHLTIQDTIDTTGQAFLGLSLGCARCHDHKYDPVNTNDYYAWYGIFESTRYSFPGSEEKKRPYDSFPVLTPGEAARVKAEYDTTLAEVDADIKRLETERKALAGGWRTYLNDRRLQHAEESRDGHEGFHVWHGNSLPVIGINTSDETRMVPGTVPPGKLVVHPQEKEGVGIAWRSPIAGRVRVSGQIHDAHDCGDSVAWFIDHLSSNGLKGVVAGATERNGSQSITTTEVAVKPGEFLQLAIMPKTHYGCDLTEVSWTVEEVEGDRRWNIVEDARDNFVKSNPRGDRYDNPSVWYFFTVEQDRGEAFGKTSPVEAANIDAAEVQRKLDEIVKRLAELRARSVAMKESGPYEVVYAAIEKDETKDAQIRIRGSRRDLGDAVPRKNLEILGDDPLPEGAGSGRLELADWLTREENPLLARVMVNRIWQHHFGRGIVGTENDFGARGERPTHPEVLDWLASRFKESGYSIKSMHRLIMASAAYQRSSDYDARAAETDPDARLLWRFNRRRLSAEEFRDSMLLLSGNLDPEMGGAHPFPAIETWGFSQHAPYYGVYPTNKRSIYLMQQRLKRHPFLALFDGADPNVSMARRELTTVPTQSLYLMNNEFVHEQALGLAKRLLDEQSNENIRIDVAYRLTLGRTASGDERVDASEFLAAYREAIAGTEQPEDAREQTAWAGFVRTLLTRNEFLFVD